MNKPEDDGVIFNLSNLFKVIGSDCWVEKVSVFALAVTKPTTSIDDVDEPVKLTANGKGAI